MSINYFLITNNEIQIFSPFLKDEQINVEFEKCLNDKTIEDYVLNDRIEGVKKFKVNATPTIIINGKKFDKALNYKNLKKYLEKLI